MPEPFTRPTGLPAGNLVPDVKTGIEIVLVPGFCLVWKPGEETLMSKLGSILFQLLGLNFEPGGWESSP